MKVLITFDVEVWCNSWETLEADFPGAFSRYVFGRSSKGDFALPKTLELLDRHGLHGVFFVEPLFAARFGVEHLATIVNLIRDAGQEIQLHLHPEWTDEARKPLLPNVTQKRQHLSYYNAEEQRELVRQGIRLMGEAGIDGLTAFRSGSFACNQDTFEAVAANGLRFDSSINPTATVSQPGSALDARAGLGEPSTYKGVGLVPMTVFRDGFGRLRHAQIGACSARELSEAMLSAQKANWSTFVLLSHNFELMVPDKLDPDQIVVKRFEQVCRFLADHRGTISTRGFNDIDSPDTPKGLPVPSVGKAATITRFFEQARRRMHG